MPKECWAACLGGCSEAISKEHYISKSLWTDTILQVRGFPWCDDETLEVSVASLTSKILCAKHNNELSLLDEVASKAFNNVERSGEILRKRKLKAPRTWEVVPILIDGHRLERWFVKTALGISAAYPDDQSWAIDGSPFQKPSIALVRLAFGLEEVVKPLGLYVVMTKGENIRIGEMFACTPVFLDEGKAVGYVFEFAALRFLLWMHTVPLPSKLRIGSRDSTPNPPHDVTHHLPAIKFFVRGRISHFLDFQWPGNLFGKIDTAE